MDIDDLDDVRASRRIVDKYKSDVDERITETSVAYPLSQALVADRGNAQDRDPWRRFFENRGNTKDSDPVTDILRIESNNLKEKWVTFYKGCSKQVQFDLGSSEPTIEGVLDVVSRIQRDWQSRRQDTRRGKAIQMFHKFCRGIHSHRSFLKILPEGNEYVSIFAGTLNVILEANANHERITEGLSEAISTITDHVADCNVELEMYETAEMKEAVARLYADIFLFLSDLIDYLTQKRLKRLLDSFNEDLYKKYEDRIGVIGKKAGRIQWLAERGSRAEIRAVRLELERLERNSIAGQEGEARLCAQLAAATSRMEAVLREATSQRQVPMQKQLMGQLAGTLNRMLEDKAFQAVVDFRTDSQSPYQGNTLQIGFSTSPLSATATPMRFKTIAEDVLFYSRHFEDFFERERVRLPGLELRPVMQTEQVIRRLSNWTQDEPGILWLEGPASPLRDQYNPLATIAARVIDLADQGNVPVISYFCNLPTRDKLLQGNTCREAQASAALITALTRQALELLLPEFETNLDLSEARLSLVDGTLESAPETLQLLGDVLNILDMQLLCIIDGLHWLDDRSTNTILSELVKTLRNSRTKVLFTTTGRTACLQKDVGRTEKLTIKSLKQRGSDIAPIPKLAANPT
ncbi:hypothetical protein PG991_015852 [Apiospora marii]|uniref:DUF7708 domain-containing protein n=1 Tax=Apiospora marii TaxID=335849 RepID=A0ABR1QZU6_9PEZI